MKAFDKNTGNYNAATFGEYADIAMEHGIPVSAGALIVLKDCIISSYKSNPYSSDKDCDGYADFEDANPEKPNENIIILLEWSANDLCNNESRMLCNNYRSLGLKCEIWEFNGYASFIEKWGWIVIMNAKQDELGGILELYYPEVFSGYNGQVLYYRLINGEYDVNLDLYPGTTDIEYIQIYGLTEEELENDTYKEANTKIRSATEVEFYGYFDPVLE